MDRNELTAVIAAALFGSVLLGWVLRWLYGRLDATGPLGLGRSAELAARLQVAEQARARAEAQLAKVEGDLTARLSDMEAELASALVSLARSEAQTDEVRAAYREAMSSQASPSA